MSQGACRALVAALLSLSTILLLTVPAAAKSEQLAERSSTRYEVDPKAGTITVNTGFILRNRQETPWNREPWGPIIVEDGASRMTFSPGFKRGSSRDVPGPWSAIDVSTPVIEPGDRKVLSVTYTLTPRRGPVRIDDGYLYFCVVGQDTDFGSVDVRIKGRERYSLTQTGTPMELTDAGLQSPASSTPGEIFTCIEGTVDEALEEARFIGPGEREIVLQAAPSDQNWLVFAEQNSEPTLDRIREFLGHDIPGQGPVIIRQTPSRDLGGYASAHDAIGIVQLDDQAGVPGEGRQTAEHQLAHAWFGADNVTERWLREGLAEWIATSMAGEPCKPVSTGDARLDLSDWQVVRPTASGDVEEVMAEQVQAACGIVSAIRERMGEEQWRAVLAGLLDGQTKYNASGGGTPSAQSAIDYREWLDAVDELGLVPAGASDPAYAANLEDLDFAQDLLTAFNIPMDPGALQQRSEARADYHRFLSESGGLAAPLVVRQALDDWEFGDALTHLEQSRQVLASLQEADALLPDAELIPFIQPIFEGAASPDELDQVAARASQLRDDASEIIGIVNELQAALPEGWSLPDAVGNAIVDQRFSDAQAAVPPALEVVAGANAANAVLPEAGLLEQYQGPFESALTATALQELADEVEQIFEDAEQAGTALRKLETAKGDWTIPAAVTAPLEEGRIADAIPVLEDALAVVTSTAAGDASLPEADLAGDFRPRFEAVTSPEELANLRTEVEQRAAQAKAVGDARATLRQLAPDWQEPVVLRELIAQREFDTAGQAAGLAREWVRDAHEADAALPQMDALARARPAFESAATIAELEAGAELARDWSNAATSVAAVVARTNEPLDLLRTMGLWGTNIDVRPAIDAAVEGDVDAAINRAAAIGKTLSDASWVGGLRLSGILFFVVAVVGVAGLWIVMRREAGPPWARQRKPHWLKDEPKKKKDGGNKRIGGGRNKAEAPRFLGSGRDRQ